MADTRSTSPAVPEKTYHNLADLAREATELLSAPNSSPTRLREVYLKYSDILREVSEITLQLYGRAKADFLSHLKDLTALKDILEHPIDSAVQRQQILEPTPQRTFPITRGDSVEARVAKYEGQVDPKVLAKVKPLIGQYIDGPTICKIAGYGKQGLYGRVRKGNVPAQGKTSSKKYLVNETTLPILFGKYTRVAEEVSKKVHSGEVLTFEEMLNYVTRKVGDGGQARIVEIMEKHGDEVQVGHDKFLKTKLDELLKAQQERR